MKTITDGTGVKGVRRVSDEEAAQLVKTGKWSYCPKTLWKIGSKEKSGEKTSK